MSFAQIPGRPAPKNGVFYTTSELKEYGTYNYSLEGVPKTPKATKSSNIENPVIEPNKSTPKSTIPEIQTSEKSSWKTKTPKKDKKDKTPKPEKKTRKEKKESTPEGVKKTKKTKRSPVVVLQSDKMYWTSGKDHKVLHHNGALRRGKSAYKLWEKWNELNSKSSTSPPQKGSTKKDPKQTEIHTIQDSPIVSKSRSSVHVVVDIDDSPSPSRSRMDDFENETEMWDVSDDSSFDDSIELLE